MNPAAVPIPMEDIQGDGRWMSMHNRFMAETKEKEPDVLFIGDSLVMHLAHTDMWNKFFAPMHALSFGIGGDQTQHVLWRVQNGELEHINPKVIVVLVGTNNHGHTAEQIAEGIQEIINVIKEKQPQAYVVVPTLLPRGQHPNPLRERNLKVNELLLKITLSIDKCQLVNVGTGFVQPDGTILHHDMYDYLHLTRSGYQKAFEPIYDLLQQLLSEGEVEAEEPPSQE